jgi:hypothetical protein
MNERRLLSEGLSIISSCRGKTGDVWHAHYGAAAIACAFLANENRMSDEAVRCMVKQVIFMVEKNRLSENIAAIPSVDAATAEGVISEALESTIDCLHWVGHNVIYAALSLKAVRELDGWGKINDINEIGGLVRSFASTIPGRSWIGYSASEVKRLRISEDDRIPSILTPKQLSEFILRELSEIEVIYRAEAHHDLIGHLLTFSHALNILYDLGYVSLFRRGLVPLLQLVKALRKSRDWATDDSIKLISPVDRKPLVEAKPGKLSPLSEPFWRIDHSHHDWDYGHHFKFTFSYYNHIHRAPEFESETEAKFMRIIGACDN